MDKVQLLNARIKEREQQLIENAKSGAERVMGYTCIYTPVELIRAAGLSPLRLFKGGDEAIASKGEFHLRSYFCHFTQCTIGAFRAGDPLYSACERIFAFGTCDQMRRTLDAIDYFYKPTTVYSLPKEFQREGAKEFYLFEVDSLKQDLEALVGHSIPDGAIWEQIRLHNQVRALLRKISSLRKQSSPPLTGRQFLDIARAYYYLPPEELLGLYEDIYQELSGGPAQRPQIRLMIVGGVFADGDVRMIEQLEQELGAAVVVEDHCAGLRPFYLDLDEQAASPLQSLAAGYLGRSPCARMRPIAERIRLAGELGQEYQVDGVIYVYLKFCTAYGIPKKLFADHFRQLGIPVFEVSNDYSHSDSGQLRTRFEAFFEMLQEAKALP